MNTDDYEGHTPGPWHIENEENNGTRLFICSKNATILWQCETTQADAQLIAAAPNLLAEVKRLQKELDLHYRLMEAVDQTGILEECNCDGDHVCGGCLYQGILEE